MQRVDSVDNTLMPGKIVGRKRRGTQTTSWLDGITDSVDMGLSELWERVEGRDACCAAAHGVTERLTQLSH